VPAGNRVYRVPVKPLRPVPETARRRPTGPDRTEALGTLPREDRRKITALNCKNLYGFGDAG